MLDGAFGRGTTPTNIFPLPCYMRLSDLEDFTITYRQKNHNVLIKHKEDAADLRFLKGKNCIAMVLSQEETLMFDPKIKIVEVQIKVRTVGSDVFTLGPYRLRLEDTFDTNEFDLSK